MKNFRDDSFISQYLSPKVIRDMKLFAIFDDEDEDEYEISAIHNERGYRKIREYLSKQYDRSTYVPDIQADKVDLHKSSKLHLVHHIQNNTRLSEEEAEETLAHIRDLWEFPVILRSRNKAGVDEEVYEC
jgi:spore cortex formation protein SpoVR/YcgB (stage V sporulation)